MNDVDDKNKADGDEKAKAKATELSFDLSKQFISLAFAGVAFVIGLSINNEGFASSLLFWITIALFAASSVLGFLFLMRGVYEISEHGKFDLWESTTRRWSIFQILFVFVGLVPLLILHFQHNGKAVAKKDATLEIVQKDSTIRYAVPANKTIKVTIDPSGRVEFDSN